MPHDAADNRDRGAVVALLCHLFALPTFPAGRLSRVQYSPGRSFSLHRVCGIARVRSRLQTPPSPHRLVGPPPTPPKVYHVLAVSAALQPVSVVVARGACPGRGHFFDQAHRARLFGASSTGPSGESWPRRPPVKIGLGPQRSIHGTAVRERPYICTKITLTLDACPSCAQRYRPSLQIHVIF